MLPLWEQQPALRQVAEASLIYGLKAPMSVLHNIPEGIAIATPLLMNRVQNLRALLTSVIVSVFTLP